MPAMLLDDCQASVTRWTSGVAARPVGVLGGRTVPPPSSPDSLCPPWPPPVLPPRLDGAALTCERLLCAVQRLAAARRWRARAALVSRVCRVRPARAGRLWRVCDAHRVRAC